MQLTRAEQESFPPAQIFAGPEADLTTTDFLHVRDYVRIVTRRRWMIAVIVAAGVSAAALYNWQAKTVFASRATLQVEADTNVLALDRPLTDRWDWAREFLPTQLGILASRDLARMAHDQLEQTSIKDDADTSTVPVPSVEEILMSRSVDAIKDTRLVTVTYRSSDPAEAARVANALASAYVQRSRDFTRRATGDASDWLTQQVEEQRKVVENGEAALQKYRSANGADALMADRLGAEQQNIVVQKLGELQGAVSKARTDTIEKEAAYRQMVAVQESGGALDSLPALASNAYLQGLKSELQNLQRQLTQASKELGDLHPDIVKLRAAVEQSELKLQREVDKAVGAVRNEFEAAKAREKGLNDALDRQKVAVQSLNSKAVQYTALEREAETNRDVLVKLLQRAREASLARELQTTSIDIVDRAEVPRAPIAPRKTRNLLIGLVASSVLALGLTFMLEVFNTRLTTPEDVERYLHVSVMGVVPATSRRLTGEPQMLLRSGVAPQYAEQIQSLRTNIVSSAALGAARTLLVTSSEPAEGKSQTATSLAISLARLHQRVLLIDADLRKPSLHTVFGVDLGVGMSEVLTGQAGASNGAFRKTDLPRLWLMTAGQVTRRPADLLGSDAFVRLLKVAQQRFDWVIIDSPPVMAVTDPCQIARLASGVLFVLDSGKTSREVSKAALQRLHAAGANVIGTVLNRADLQKPGVSYLPYYHRDYETHYPELEFSSVNAAGPDTLLPEVPSDPRHPQEQT